MKAILNTLSHTNNDNNEDENIKVKQKIILNFLETFLLESSRSPDMD